MRSSYNKSTAICVINIWTGTADLYPCLSRDVFLPAEPLLGTTTKPGMDMGLSLRGMEKKHRKGQRFALFTCKSYTRRVKALSVMTDDRYNRKKRPDLTVQSTDQPADRLFTSLFRNTEGDVKTQDGMVVELGT